MEHFAKKIISKKEFRNRELNDQKIVFTNGCFDILHLGHLEYLFSARQLGDLLVLGLNSDDSVKRLKGSSRPVNSFNIRASMLASLYFIDYVIEFSEDTPYELIKSVKPDILVKGGDYNINEIVGGDIVKGKGGKIITIPFVEGFSTTSFIQRLKDEL